MKAAGRRHLPFLVALVASAIALAVALPFARGLAPAIAANLFFLAYLAATLARLPAMTPDWLSSNAASSDVPVWIIFAVTLGAICLAIALLFDTVNAKPAPDPVEFTLALTAVPLGWLTIHLMCAIHYAHEYWQPDERSRRSAARGGLDFPGTKRPAGTDFVYFAFVVGMTAQTADVAITHSAMRRNVLLHGIVSFFFNAVIVAAAVNLAVAIGN